MAIQEQVILEVATGKSDLSLSKLKDRIKELKGELNEAAIGSQEYQQTLQKLQQSQNMLRDAMYGSTASAEDLAKSTLGLTDSYNGLVHQMADLKQAFRATTDEAERMKLGAKINEINNQLKAMDAMQGNYSRNVGNYANSITQAFSQAGAMVGGPFSKGVGVANNSLKLLSANPIIAVITVLVTIFQQVAKAIKQNEEASNALSEAFSAFSAIGDLVVNIIGKLAEKVVGLATAFANLVKKIFGVTEAMDKRQELAKKDIELTERQREATMKDAEAQLEVAKLRAKVAEKDKYTAEQRLSMLKKANDLEEQIAKRAADNAKLEYEQIKAKNALTATSAEDKQKEADAYAKMLQAQTAYFQKQKELNRQMTTARREMVQEEREDQQAAREEAKAQADDARTQLEAQKILLDARLQIAENGSEEEMELLREKSRLEMEQAIATATEKIANEEDRAAAIEAITQAHYNRLEALEDQHLQAEIDAETAAIAEQMRQEDIANKQREKNVKDRIKLSQQGAAAVSGLLKSLADAYESDENASEEQLKAAKNMKIAGATIDMLNGVVTAVSTAMQLGPIAGPIMGAINSAAIIATGVANIAKMKQQSTSKTSGGSTTTPTTATVSAPQVAAAAVPTYRALTSASEEDRLNAMASDSRVVLVMSDLEAAEHTRKVQVEESTF